MMKVLDRRLKTTQPMQQDKSELHEYLLQFCDEKSGRLDYQQMASDLRGFHYDNETNLGIIPKSQRSISSGRYSFNGTFVNKNAFTDDLTVLDSMSVPANKLDTIERHFIKVNRHLQERFGSAEKLEEFLREKIDSDKNGNIDVQEMKSLIAETCAGEVANRRLTKQDLEGFLSAFKYNAHGTTNLTSIAPLVFEKDSNKLSIAIAKRIRTNPPPQFVNKELSQTVAAAEAEIKDETTARRLRKILSEIEYSSFYGGKQPKAFEIFRSFDMDGDGFVSYKDFEANLKKHKIEASEEDVSLLMKAVLDTDGNGFIDFNCFKDKFGSDMSNLIPIHQNELHKPNLVPNKEKLGEYGHKMKHIRSSLDDVKKSFQPEPDASKYLSTSFANLVLY